MANGPWVSIPQNGDAGKIGVTVGSGEFRYELVESWPKMPKYWEFGGASDAAVNSVDEIHVFSRGKHPLTVWDTDGNFVSS